MSSTDEIVAEPVNLAKLIQDASHAIAHRQLKLSEAKVHLETTEARAKDHIKHIVESVEGLANRISFLLRNKLTQILSSRRSQLEELTNILSATNPEVVQLCTWLQDNQGISHVIYHGHFKVKVFFAVGPKTQGR